MTTMTPNESPEPVIPDYSGRCTTSLVPALSWGLPTPVLSDEVVKAKQSVLLVLDSLGWEQLQTHLDVAPTLGALSGTFAHTVAPSTTAAALTSIATGVPVGEHGLVGYRFKVAGSVLNSLRWSTPGGVESDAIEPREVQPVEPFAGASWSIVSDRAFARSKFTEAYLGSGRYLGFQHPSSIIAETRAALDEGDRRIYAYYDGLDHVAHIYGVSGAHYRAELGFCDWLVASMIDALPSGTALIVTGDHGQVDAPELVTVASDVVAHSNLRSGESRFRWLHAKPGREADLLEAAQAAHGDVAWVRSREQIIDEGWFGARVSDAASDRLGDVALVAHQPLGFDDPGEPHADRLYGRHGSLTAEEIHVPVVYTVV